MESVVFLSWGVGEGVQAFSSISISYGELETRVHSNTCMLCLGFPLRPISVLNVLKLVSALEEGLINLYET